MTFNYNNFIRIRIIIIYYTSITKTLTERVIFNMKEEQVTQS